MAQLLMRSFSKLLVVVALCVSLQSVSTLAKTRPSASDLLKSSLNQKVLATAGGRSDLVSAAADYCNDLDKAFPRNSPTEDAWLDREFAAGTERLLRATNSAEFSRRQAAIFISSCLSASAAYNDGRRQLGLNLLVYAFARFDGDAAVHARRNSIAPEDYELPLMSVMLEGLAFAALTEAEQAGR
ncbi:MAG: hypothetical protein ACTHJU_02450 [Sphingopyxis sp.]